MKLYLLSVLLLIFCHGVLSANVAGSWSPWQQDASVDCCTYGGVAKYARYCNLPYPEGEGQLCQTLNGNYSMVEDQWRTCTCACTTPTCDNNSTFCANDTKAPAYCECRYNYVRQVGHDYFADPQRCVPKDQLLVTAAPPSAVATGDGLTKSEKDDLDIAHFVTVSWILGWIGLCIILQFVFMNLSPLRLIHLNEEICLVITYVFILLFVEKSSDKDMCRMSAIILHYFFMACMVFFCLEALYAYSLVTYVVPRDGFFSRLINIGAGYGAPIIAMAFSLGFLWDKYGRHGHHCWCDMSTNQSWAFFMPITILGFIATVIGEAQGQGNYEALAETDKSQFASAKVSQQSMVIVMLCAILSYCVGMVSVDNQNIVSYAFFFIFNIIFGPVIFYFHCIANPKLADVFDKIQHAICPCCFSSEKPIRPKSSNKVAPIAANDPNEMDRDPSPAPPEDALYPDDDDDEGERTGTTLANYFDNGDSVPPPISKPADAPVMPE